MDVALKIAGVEKDNLVIICGCGKPKGYLIRVLNERSINNGGDFCLLWCYYTPVLDKFLPDFVPKCKSEGKVLRKTQDLPDVAGPIAMFYEMVWQAKENAQPLDLSILLSCLKTSLQLLGNVNN